MFSPTLFYRHELQEEERLSKEQVIQCFEALKQSLHTSSQSIAYLTAGQAMLRKWRYFGQLDIILVGTLFNAFAESDFKYYGYSGYWQHFDELRLDQLDDFLNTLNDSSRNDLVTRIKAVGKAVLLDKKINFYGKFSNVWGIEPLINDYLPELADQYFAKYDITAKRPYRLG